MHAHRFTQEHSLREMTAVPVVNSFTLVKAKLIQAQLLVALSAMYVVALLKAVYRARLKGIFVVVVVYAMEMTHVV